VKSSGYGRVSVGSNKSGNRNSVSPRVSGDDTTTSKEPQPQPSASSYADAIRKKRMSTTTGLAACSPMRNKGGESGGENGRGVVGYKNKNQTGWKTVSHNSHKLLARGTPTKESGGSSANNHNKPTTPVSAMKRAAHKVVDSLVKAEKKIVSHMR